MKYNLSKIRGKSAYTMQEISKLLSINRKTVARWLKEGLIPLDVNQKPTLVMGKNLKSFLRVKREAKRVKLNWNEFYCLKCRKAVLAKRGSEKTEKTGKKIGANNIDQEIIFAKCKVCNTPLARFI